MRAATVRRPAREGPLWGGGAGEEGLTGWRQHPPAFLVKVRPAAGGRIHQEGSRVGEDSPSQSPPGI